MAKLCSWMGLLTFILFYTDFVAERLYNGAPGAEPGSPERLRYEKGRHDPHSTAICILKGCTIGIASGYFISIQWLSNYKQS